MEDGISNAVNIEELDELVATLISDPGSELYAALQNFLDR